MELPLDAVIEHDGKIFKVVLKTGDPKDCRPCAACVPGVALTPLCCKLRSCEAGGRDDGVSVMWVEVVQ